ncbi:ATP-binding protein [Streptomyces sp. NPDC048718]|uniref:ATP-binding protein n=1 Tax=Streptomyces sp. NPDC048718 TaxID=3365587 RepID=UPI00371CF525
MTAPAAGAGTPGATVGKPASGIRLGPLRRIPIVLRLVLAVAAAMTVVLVSAAGFVYWRVEFALDQQLDGDLSAYEADLVHSLTGRTPAPRGPEGSVYQIVRPDGRVLHAGPELSDERLLTPADLAAVARGATVQHDVGALLPIDPAALRLRATRVRLPGRTLVVVAAMERAHRDEALRELLAQLAIAAGLTLLASSLVGYRTARAALGPVERYRRSAAELADHTAGTRLPVPADRDDELTRLGHTLNGMLDRLEDAAERERRFLADASHELRTPLALLRAELDVALHRPRTAAELTDTLAAVDAEVQRLVDLTNALLDLEEIGGTERVTRTPVDVESLVRSTVDPYRTNAGRGRRALTVDAESVTARVDARWIRPALGNLIDNALRHGTGDVRITAVVRDGRLRLSVADEGTGFPPGFLPHAFDRFSRAETSRSTPGSGLGLAFAAAVAASHGGVAHADNTADGAVVTLDIPC